MHDSLRSATPPRALNLTLSPADIAARWPVDQRLLWLHSGRIHRRWARWSILASPKSSFRFDGRSHIEGDAFISQSAPDLTHDPLLDLDAMLRATAINRDRLDPYPTTFRGGWIGSIAYELGRVIEPRATHREKDFVGGWPLIELAWCPDALIYDHLHQQWHAVGEPPALSPDSKTSVIGAIDFTIGELEPASDDETYRAMVERTLEYIAAGDIFQANIARRFATQFEGSTRSLALAAFAAAEPWYGAYLESREPGRCIVSLSPELFLSSNAMTRRVITRPIKGTLPASRAANLLAASAKDQAELNMIVDLMRNDLGRVCEFGSVRVPQPRIIETHPTVHHGVAEIAGRLRPDVKASDLLRATFPPGSVTGAPKVRAMQIIDELESTTLGLRGPYCGAIGMFSDCGAMTLNVAIRTMTVVGRASSSDRARVEGGRLSYCAGAGIVADSDADREQQETRDKTAVVHGLVTAANATNPGVVETLPRAGGRPNQAVRR